MRKYWVLARVSLQNAVEYRGSVVTRYLFYALFLFVFYHLWRAIYAGGGVEGYTFQQLVWYLCVTELIAYGSRLSVHSDIAQDVKSGTIAYHLLRPCGYVGQLAASAVGQVTCSLALFIPLALITGFVAVGPIEGYRLWTLGPAFLSILLGVALNFLLRCCLGLLAFRLEDVAGLALVYSKLVFMTGTFLPVEFLPEWIRGAVKLLPFPYVSWGPARLAVAFSWAECAAILSMQALWIALTALLAAALNRAGMRGMQMNGG